MNKNHAGGLFFLFVGVCFFFLSIKLPIGEFTQPGPAIFPLFLSLFLIIIGLSICFSGKKKANADQARGPGNFAKPVAIILLTLTFIIFMGKLGYLITSFLYLFGLFYLVSRIRLLYSAGLSGVLSAGSWYFFGKFLGIFLPMGPWNL